MTQSYVGVTARPGREDEARKLMAELRFAVEPDSQHWMVPYGGTFPDARRHLIERLDRTDWDWSEVLSVGDLPDHPDA